MIFNTKQVADFFGVTDRAVRLWADNGCPKIGHGKWNLKDVHSWWLENLYQGGEDGEDLNKAKTEYWQAKARNEKVKADLAEGSVMSIGELKKAWAWRINEVSTGLGMIPFRLASLIVGKTEMEIRKILDDEIWKIRDNYSRTGKFCPKVKMPKSKKKPVPKKAKVKK